MVNNTLDYWVDKLAKKVLADSRCHRLQTDVQQYVSAKLQQGDSSIIVSNLKSMEDVKSDALENCFVDLAVRELNKRS